MATSSTFVSASGARTAVISVSPSQADALHVGLLGMMLAMTGLTYVKETGYFQSIHQGIWMQIYHFARYHYYQCLVVSLVLALVLTILRVKEGQASRTRQKILSGIWFVFGLNFFLLTANNGLNLLQGRPLHCQHRGIGW